MEFMSLDPSYFTFHFCRILYEDISGIMRLSGEAEVKAADARWVASLA
jgi:hypothetical protein